LWKFFFSLPNAVQVTSIFVSTLFLSVNAFNSVLSVFEVERNMFYRHKAARMYDQKGECFAETNPKQEPSLTLLYRDEALVWALTVAEIPFIVLSSIVFVAIFYFMLGFAVAADKFFLYYLFFTLYLAAFTFLGQVRVTSLVRS
jgi:hypothetical protein